MKRQCLLTHTPIFCRERSFKTPLPLPPSSPVSQQRVSLHLHSPGLWYRVFCTSVFLQSLYDFLCFCAVFLHYCSIVSPPGSPPGQRRVSLPGFPSRRERLCSPTAPGEDWEHQVSRGQNMQAFYRNDVTALNNPRDERGE